MRIHPIAEFKSGVVSLKQAAQVSMPAVILGISVALLPWVPAVAWPTMLAFLLLWLLIRKIEPAKPEESLRRHLIVWTFSAFCLHLAIGAAITYSSQVANFGPDALDYHRKATEVAGHWSGENLSFPKLSPGKEGFYYLLAGFYWLLGPYMATGLIINAALGAALLPLMTNVTQLLFGVRSSKKVAPLILFLPGLLIWPSQLLKEAAVLFLLALSLHAAVLLAKQPKFTHVLSLSLSVAVLLTFRSAVAVVIAATLLVALILGHRPVTHKLAVALSLFATLAGIVFGLGLGYSGYGTASTSDLEDLTSFQATVARSAGSGFYYGAEIKSLDQALPRLPLVLTRFALGPFPWEIENPRQALGLVDSIPMWFLLIPLIRGLFLGSRIIGRNVLILLLPAVALTALLSLAAGNYGLLLRERTQVTLLVLPFVALGLSSRAEEASTTVVSDGLGTKRPRQGRGIPYSIERDSTEAKASVTRLAM